MPSRLKTKKLAARLLRSLARRHVLVPISREEIRSGPFTRLIGLEDALEESAHAEWVQYLREWDLTNIFHQEQLRHVIQSAAEEAVDDVRRSFSGIDHADIPRLIDLFSKHFDPNDLLQSPSVSA